MTGTPDLDRLWELMEDIRICMMTTRDGEDLRSRPMQAVLRRDQETVFFFTDANDHKDDELRRDAHACLAFADKDDHNFVSVSGKTEVLNDRALARELWNKEAEAYFPDGPESPNLRVLRFSPEFGEFWAGPSSSIVAQVKMAAARVRGERPDMGEDKKVTFGSSR